MTDSFEKKTAIRVRLTVEGSEPHNYTFFKSGGERIIDVLNDSRKFLPVVDDRGEVHIVSKDKIVWISTYEE